MTLAGHKSGIAIFPVTERGHDLAKRFASECLSAEVFPPEKLREGRLKGLVEDCFSEKKAILFICASGIAVRAIAPFVKAKDLDPAVLVMDEGARFVVSLLSGHIGGANRLARDIARFFNATPVVTTATDVMGVACLEEISGALGLTIDDIRSVKTVNRAMLDKKRVYFVDGDRARLEAARGLFGAEADMSFVRTLPKSPDGCGAIILVTSSTAALPAGYGKKTAVLRPKEVVVGIGCRKGASSSEISRAVTSALKDSGLSFKSIKNLATIDIKKDEPGLLKFASKSGLDTEFFNAIELNGARPPSGPSDTVKRHTGATGVSENAALLSSGARRLCIRKRKSEKVTVAAALAPFTSLE